ncbi:MAG: ATP-binding protein [Deltaproteobacteria bacterium]|nr:ATP-binding protein [Deltaproteobacteria bacterium]
MNVINEERENVGLLDGQNIEVSLPSKIGYERIAMQCSASFAKMVGFAPARIEDLKTVVSEACLNAMEHGNKEDPNVRVTVKMNFKDSSITVFVRDEGTGVEKIPAEPDIIKKIERLETPRGLGIFLIKQLADQVDLNQMTKDGHVVRMVIRMNN